MNRTPSRWAALPGAALLALTLAACGSGADAGSGSGSGSGGASGTVAVDGSSTVFPMSNAAYELLSEEPLHPAEMVVCHHRKGKIVTTERHNVTPVVP